MADTEKFPSEMDPRGTVKVTDKLMITNIDTGNTEYTTVAELLAAFGISISAGDISIATTGVIIKITAGGSIRLPFVLFADYADNAAAKAGGMVNGDVYRTAEILKIVHA